MKKLGIKAGYRLYVHEPPLDYFDWLHPSPTDVEIAQKISGKFNFIHVFVQDQRSFRSLLTKGKKYLEKDGMFWVSWPKKSSGVVNDLDENIIR